MTEPTDAAENAAGGEEAGQQPSTYTPPATQADLDRIIAERVARTKNQFKDYGDLKAAAAELAQIKQANQSEAERLAEETARWQSEAEKWRTASVSSQVRALAAQSFTDPSDAVGHPDLDPSKYLDAGGEIDEEAIKADLEALLEKKPHWRRPEGAPGPRVPAPNPAQGAGGGRPASDPAQEFASILRGQLGP